MKCKSGGNHVIVCMIDGITKCGKCDLIESIWSVIDKYNIKPSINCYGTSILAASKANKEDLVDKLTNTMKTKYIKDMDYDRCWNQILIAYGINLSNYTAMWNEYIFMKKFMRPSVITLSILTSIENKEYQLKALKEAKKYISNWNDLTHKELKGFYRTAINVDDKELMNILYPILESIHKNIDVTAEIKDDKNNKILLDNFYKYEDSNILKKVDDLIEESKHKIDVSMHPEIKSPILAHRLISYHAEKKALAKLLLLDENRKDIKIKVSMRMCTDCHIFFGLMSKLYPNKDFIVIDPRDTHKFINGNCCCGK